MFNNIASKETYHDGQIIIKEGSSGDWVYVVLSGTVEISKMVGGKKFVLELLQPGEVFGELAFLGGVKRTATARAIGETTVGVYDRAFLDQEFNKLYSDFRVILISVAERLKRMIDRATEFSTRKETRVLVTLPLRYKSNKTFINAYAGNLSSEGLFIMTDNPLKQGEQFFLELQLPDLLDPIEAECEVMWARKKMDKKHDYPTGMGVKFIGMTKNNQQMLKQYLENVSKDEEKNGSIVGKLKGLLKMSS
ncbi:MAG: TIGR02266 family protein [Thermodesulfobacteriota bacterium]|nr:TIGR02266 family protein [Thermodesulfobacteriota bacterium]